MSNGLAAFLLFFVPLVSGLLVWKISPRSPHRMKLLLSFSGAYLLALCFLHLIPEVYQSEKIGAGIFILVGFVIQLLLEFLSGGIEHGHFHFHSKSEKNFPFTLMVSLCIHTYLECLPLANMGTVHADHVASGHSLIVGILLHNIPVAVTLMTVLMQSGVSKRIMLMSLFVFSLVGPLGLLTGFYFEDFLLGISPDFYRFSLAVVIGIFLHVSTTILFESGEGHRFNLLKLGTVAAGSTLAFLSL